MEGLGGEVGGASSREDRYLGAHSVWFALSPVPRGLVSSDLGAF